MSNPDSFLLIDNATGHALNRVVLVQGSAFTAPDGQTLIPDDERALYAPPVVNPPLIPRSAFLGRFAPGELLAIATAAQTNAAIAVWTLTAQSFENIDLMDPQTVAGVNALAGAGLITAARAAAILTP